MTITELQQKRVGILGFGQEGQAVFAYLKKHGITAQVFDHLPLVDWSVQKSDVLEQHHVTPHTGEDYITQAKDHCDVLFKSPGVLIKPAEQTLLVQNDVTVTSQTAWFFEHSLAKIIGVTGTKGKGTTSSLLTEILQANGQHKVFLTGNIGKQAPLEFLDELSAEDLVVFELSSFQLENLQRSPQIGICLMVTNDHLDYHDSQAEYWQAKQAIAKFQTQGDFLIYNLDYEGSRAIGKLGAGAKLAISAKQAVEQGAQIFAGQEKIEVNVAEKHFSLSTTDRFLKGAHNLENIAAATLASSVLGVDEKIISATLKTFAGLPHRLQNIGTFDDITFYDDSIATNPDTTLAALRAFSEPITLLLGGADKGLDYAPMIAELKNVSNLHAIVAVGKVGDALLPDLQEAQLKAPILGPFHDFKAAVGAAISASEAGGIVLLSPAATSFDMFENYAERGEQFAQLVKEHYA
jgi:UDP-N-acetylmuramoylalanine--D-glutamate ligase